MVSDRGLFSADMYVSETSAIGTLRFSASHAAPSSRADRHSPELLQSPVCPICDGTSMPNPPDVTQTAAQTHGMTHTRAAKSIVRNNRAASPSSSGSTRPRPRPSTDRVDFVREMARFWPSSSASIPALVLGSCWPVPFGMSPPCCSADMPRAEEYPKRPPPRCCFPCECASEDVANVRSRSPPPFDVPLPACTPSPTGEPGENPSLPEKGPFTASSTLIGNPALAFPLAPRILSPLPLVPLTARRSDGPASSSSDISGRGALRMGGLGVKVAGRGVRTPSVSERSRKWECLTVWRGGRGCGVWVEECEAARVNWRGSEGPEGRGVSLVSAC